MPTGGTISVYTAVAAPGLNFQLDGNALLSINAPIAAGNTIDLAGNANTISILDSTVFPHAAGATITGFNTTDVLADSLREGGIIYQLGTVAFADGTLTLTGTHLDLTPVIYTLNLAGDYSGDTFGIIGNGDVVLNPGTTTPVPCFAAGTLIDTERGAIAVERLLAGDTVVTDSGKPQPIQWIGHRTLRCRRHPTPDQVMPIRVRAGAFADSKPRRDLWLSPDHAVFVNGVLIPVKHLINGTTVARMPVDEVTYYHVALPRHDILLAEGLPAESYLDVADRSNFANGGGVTAMHADFALDEACEAMWEAAGCVPLRIAGAAFDRVVARLRRRARLLGQACPRGTRRRAGLCGVAATDIPRLVDPGWYLANNPDVADAGVEAGLHYVTWGRHEGRLPCDEIDLVRGLGLMDPGTVAFTMADVIVAGIDPVVHFCQLSWRERRRPNAYFDTGWYLDTHAVPEAVNPLLHYVLLGEPSGLAPSVHFDPAWYRRRYALGPMVSPLAHYLAHRRTQAYSPLPTFDAAAYVAAHAATLRPDRDPYAHFLAIGQFASPGAEPEADRIAAFAGGRRHSLARRGFGGEIITTPIAAA